jgi:integrase
LDGCHAPKLEARYMRLEESIPIFLEHVSAHNAEGTLEAYTQRLEKFRQFVGRRGVTRRVALEWINHLLSVERLSKRTVAHYRRTVRTFYAWLVENEFEKQNPVSKGSKLHPSSAPKPTFSDDEVARLLATARDTEFWEYGCRMGYDTGLRLSDVAEMEWQSVNFTTHSVKLMPRKTKRFEKIVEIPLSQATMDLLDKMKLAAGASQFVAPWMAMQFAADRHRTLSMQFIRLAHKALVFKSYHCYRHTFVTRMLAANVHPALIASMTGHSLAQIMNYAHPTLETKRAAMANVVNL